MRQAAIANEEVAFEYVYDRDVNDHALREATISAMNPRARRNRPTPEEIAAYRREWQEPYRQRWLRQRHSSNPGSR